MLEVVLVYGASVGGEPVTTHLAVDGVELMAMFQRYESRSAALEGEILSRPDVTGPIESFFSSLEVGDQFTILDWHLALSETIADVCGAKVAINIHNSLIEHEEDRESFLSRIRRHTTPVVFEFTETYPMPPVESANLMLRELRECGHFSALDDFGSGYNGMSLFTDYDFDVVKFDQSLIFGLSDDSEGLRALRLLRQMLDELGKSHVVEGVESEEVHQLLLNAGFTTFQGHLFHRPVPVEDLLFDREISR